jgi:hypothetical protein
VGRTRIGQAGWNYNAPSSRQQSDDPQPTFRSPQQRAAPLLAVLLVAGVAALGRLLRAPAGAPQPSNAAPVPTPPPTPPKAQSPEITAPARPAIPGTFTNPIFARHPLADPWIAQKDGWYYLTFTAGGHVEIWRSRTLAGFANIKDEDRAVVWRAPRTGPNSRDIWAPEIHFVRGRWFIYYTATDENRRDANRRIFVLEAESDNPLGAYRDRGRIEPPGADFYAIDGTVYEAPTAACTFCGPAAIPKPRATPRTSTSPR